MIKPDLIIKTNRRSISIIITKEGKVVVRAPKRISADYILNFIKEKEKWIDKKLKLINNTNLKNSKYMNYEEFLFCGSSYKLLFIDKFKKIELCNNNILCPTIQDRVQLINKIKRWYMKTASKILGERLEYFAKLMQVNYKNLTISNSKNRWGSCDKEGNIKLNFRVIMLPHRVIDYIIVHELSHIIQFNHSKDFYKIIGSIIEDYKQQQKNLKEQGFVLTLFR